MIDIVRREAAEHSNRQGYAFLEDGEAEGATLTFGELDLRARAIAALLESVRGRDERVLLLYPPGLEYVSGFLGCLYARAVAVPLPPPRSNRRIDRLAKVAADSKARIVLTTQSILGKAGRFWNDAPDLKPLTWLATDALGANEADNWQHPSIKGNTPAFLQYTSGSTGRPRGVIVTHENLLHNEALIQRAFNQNRQSIILSWLPLYHDMGLIGGVLQPLYLGARCILMPPLAFLERPIRWLRAISAYKATTSGGPDFAYELCARRIAMHDCPTLDLTSWSVAFNGSEPVRKETLEDFTKAFEPFGFRKQSFFPCYGLAEATLFVSGGGTGSEPLVKTVSADSLRDNRIVYASPGAECALSLAASGRVYSEQDVRIVDPESLTPCAADLVGEIWVSGPSVAAGYYNRPDESRRTFQARIRGTDDGPFLRTGDLGFIKDGELFVTGRLKDLIIIRGQNYYPQDIEVTACRSSPQLRKGGGAAFSVEADGRERLVIVLELETRRAGNVDAIVEAVRQAIAEEHQVPVYAIALIKKGGLPRTSSGKVRRHACRAEFLAGKLGVVASWVDRSSEAGPGPAARSIQEMTSVRAVEDWLVSLLSAKLDLRKDAIAIDQPVSRYGIDSLAATEMAHNLESGLGVPISLGTFLKASTIRELAKTIFERRESSRPVAARLPSSEPDGEFGLSRGQQALYFLHQFASDVGANNISVLARVWNGPDTDALTNAFRMLTDRHPSLRAGFRFGRLGETVQRIREAGQWDNLRETDATSWTAEELERRILEEAGRKFDLMQDDLLRIRLYNRGDEALMLAVVDHIVADFWSLGLVFKELGVLYSQETRAPQAPPSCHYSEYVKWQEGMLASDQGDRLWAYWKEKLSGELPLLDLPTDRPRPPIQTFAGGSQVLTLPAESASGLDRLSRTSGTTQFITLAALFELLLHRYTGQDDVLLGVLTNGRTQSRFADVVGYFANPVVFRADFSSRETFSSFLSQTRTTALEAFEHQDYPFPLLVEQLNLERDGSRAPLAQAMFFYQRSHLPDQEALASLASGNPGGRARIGEMEVEFLPLNQTPTQFDLILKMAAAGSGISGALEYNSDLFDASTIRRMLDHFGNLIEACLRSPDLPLWDLSMMSQAERREILLDRNDTRIGYPEGRCVHDLIEARAATMPDAVAVTFEGEQLTYAELDERANQTADRLIEAGAGPEMRVGVCIRRSIEMVIGLLGALKSGGAYVPLDPAFPPERLSFMVSDSGACAIITQRGLIDHPVSNGLPVFYIDADSARPSRRGRKSSSREVDANNPAYVIYTSGSTGRPKGVIVCHRNVVNFFEAMDEWLGSESSGRWLAVTSVSFDISVLELLWTLSRGFSVVIQGEQRAVQRRPSSYDGERERGIDFSLFYFASDDREAAGDRYRLLFEGARFADQNGFSAVWTPERHFHPFGGLYPNPSVTGAAVAAVTQNVKIRAGSVVLPLHNPIRVAEEWSVIDNISRGRAGISVASGWHADDFILSPQSYHDRKRVMLDSVEIIRRLWRGEPVSFVGGAGNEVEARIFPRPVQRELPLWVTAAGNPETFQVAGEIGANLLTHLLGQSLQELADKISIYRKAWRDRGHGPGAGHVTLMVHTFIGEDVDEVRARVMGPFTSYLKSSYGLIANLAKSLGGGFDPANLDEDDVQVLLSHAFDRYFDESGLMGTLTTCLDMVERMKAAGVDEVACLIDFGVDADSVLDSLHNIKLLMERASERCASSRESESIFSEVITRGVTHLQCTPSLSMVLLDEAGSFGSLRGLKELLLGGEALTLELAKQLREIVADCVLHNMYGPTETTIWSTADRVDESASRITIGRPVGNTETYILDRALEPAPANVPGLLYIGGEGVVRGYVNSPDVTAEKFIPDPFSGRAGGRLYATGDVARYLQDRKIEFLGRVDQQVKLRGYRVELGEIEAALQRHPAVRHAAVLKQRHSTAGDRLVAYVVEEAGNSLDPAGMRRFLSSHLPEYMIPSALVTLDSMPLTRNGKVDRRALPPPEQASCGLERSFAPPRNAVEEVLAVMWADVLDLDQVGIHDNFFELGGHSIMASRLVARLRETLDLELPLRSFFQAPTVAGTAALIFENPQQQAKAERMAQLLISVAQCPDDQVEALLHQKAL